MCPILNINFYQVASPMAESAFKTTKPTTEAKTHSVLEQAADVSSPSLAGYVLHMQGIVGNRAIQSGLLDTLNEKLGKKPVVGKILNFINSGKKETDLPGQETEQEEGVGLPEVDNATTSAPPNNAPATQQPLGSGPVDLPGQEGGEGANSSNAKSLGYDKPLKQQDLLKEYQEQERDRPQEQGIGPKQTWNRKAPGAPVKYIQTEEERAAYELLLDASKQLFVWKEQVIDTTAMKPAFSIGMVNKSNGRVIFVMTASGKIYVADEGKETRQQEIMVNNQKMTVYLSLFNHSSLVAGSPVTAAGEMFFTQGRLTRITDFSGHYQPSIEHTMQVLEALDKGGLQGLDQVEVEFFVGEGQTQTARQLLDLKKTVEWSKFRNTLELKAFDTSWARAKFDDAHTRIKTIFSELSAGEQEYVLKQYYLRGKYYGDDELKMMEGFFSDLGRNFAEYDRQRQQAQAMAYSQPPSDEPQQGPSGQSMDYFKRSSEESPNPQTTPPSPQPKEPDYH